MKLLWPETTMTFSIVIITVLDMYCKQNNQMTNGPINAHLISEPILRTNLVTNDRGIFKYKLLFLYLNDVKPRTREPHIPSITHLIYHFN